MRLEDFTFVVTTFKSEDIIFNCLKSIPKNCNKIVVENSNNLELKKKIRKNI